MMRTSIASMFLLVALGTACPRDQGEPPGQDETGISDDDGGSETGTDCEGPDGCWNCAPTDPLQILNGCTDATCDAFPNTPERLPLLERDGSLPPIP